MAQLEARLDGIEEVRGSNPLGSTNPTIVAFTLGEMNLPPLFNYLRPNLAKLIRPNALFANKLP